MTDQDVRDLLERMAAEEPIPFLDAEPLTRRARRRAARTVVVGAVGVSVAVAILFAGLGQLRSVPLPADEPRPTRVASGALTYAYYGDIYVADPDGSNAVKIADATADTGCEGFSEYSIPDPPWSPDGRYVAFQYDCTSPRQTTVVIADPDGNVVGEVPAYGGGWGFTWAPDSTRVAVWEPALTMGVYGVDGQRQASMPVPRLTGGGNDAAPGWMPDGSALLLNGYGVVPLDGTAAYELSPGRRYSPDWTRYVVSDDERHVVAFYEADGSPVSIARLAGDHDESAWSPDGQRFASLGAGELNLVDVASGTVTHLSEARAALDGGDEILDVRGFSPAGDRILYAAGRRFAGAGNTALWSIGVDGSDAHVVVAGTADGAWRSR